MSVVDDYRGLPIAELISAPLIGAAQAQGQLAHLTSEFVQSVGVDPQNNKIRTVDFTYPGYDNTGAQVDKKLQVPLLSIVNIPNLAVKKAEVEFTMEVKQQVVDKSSTDKTGSFEGKAGWGPFSAKISGSVTTKSEHTRQTDKSAKYDVKVEARDDGPPEGLARILDILANNMKQSAGGSS